MTDKKLTPTPLNVFNEVCRIRSEKLPDLFALPNVGSFFKNPMVTKEQVFKLQLDYPELPTYSVEDDAERLKLSAAWLIDRVGLKRARIGSFEVSEQHALVIVNRGGGQSTDLLKLIERIRTEVYKRFRVKLKAEPRFFPET